MAKLKRPPLVAPGLALSSSDAPSARQIAVGGPGDPREVLYGRPTLTDAMHFYLMTGQQPSVRLRGWVTVAQHEFEGPFLWSVHRDALVSEAQAAGIIPFWQSKRTPKGTAFLRWRREFLARHRY